MINAMEESVALSDYAKTRFFISLLERDKHENYVGVGKIILAEKDEHQRLEAFAIEFEQYVKIGTGARVEDEDIGCLNLMTKTMPKLMPLHGTRKTGYKQQFGQPKEIRVVNHDEIEIILDGSTIKLYLPNSMQGDHIESILKRSTLI